MCYAIPGKVESIKEKIVVVDYFGEKKNAINELDGLKTGDYIYAQGGYVIKAVPAAEAQEILSVWRETFFELHELDLRLSRLDLEKKGIDKKLALALDKVLEGREASREELLYLLNLEKREEKEYLFKAANFLRQKYLGNSCCVHGVIEFSNHCRRDCGYCGISVHNKNVIRYRMTEEEIIETAYDAVENKGFKALVLQSGEDTAYSIDDLCDIIRAIKKRCAVLIFMSVGERGEEGLRRMYKAGARGVLMRFESSNPKLEKRSASRVAELKAAYKMGYLILTGGLIGLPGQTIEDQLNDILLAKELNAEMFSFGPFLPHPETPFARRPAPSTDQVMKALAVSRIADPKNAKILVTTGFETLDPAAREKGLMAGANSVMLNVTPEKFRKKYSIYPNRAHDDEPLQEQIDNTLGLLRNIGRAPTDLGVST